PERVGLLLYNIEDFDCEILVLHSLEEGKGMGTALVDTLRAALKETAIQRVWLITTNDNLPALKFWQKHGFVLKALHVDSIQEARRLKPQIPIVGHEGIPVRDEIELEWKR
ncbi:MAG: GNAT family N-acetyltransferase, partial [Aggregatilineales bacterium]